MFVPPNGFASRPLSASRYRSLALAATLLPCAVLPLLAATKHAHTPAPSHKAIAVATSRNHVTTKAHTAAPARRNSEIARAEAAQSRSSHKSGRKEKEVEAEPVPAKSTAHLSPREALAAKAAAYRNAAPKAKSAPQLPAAKPVLATTKAPETAKPDEDVVADRKVQDRVHAWMRSHGSTSAPEETALAKPDDILSLPPAKPVSAKAPRPAPEPDLSTTPRKATVEDFDRAARRQSQTLRSVAAQNQTRSTADDDAAEQAASHIPSTAPTARVALPFTHGDLLSATSDDSSAQPATPPDTATRKKPGTHTNAVVLAKTPLDEDDDDESPAPARASGTQTAAVTIPRLQPAPIVRTAPASVAIATAAKHPSLDPGVAASMTQDAFDDDAPTPTAGTLSTKVSKSGTAKPALTPALDEDPDTASTSRTVKVNLYDGSGHLHILPPMKGSHEILVHQNQMAVSDGLDRIEDDDQLNDMRRLKLLVALPDNDAIQVNDAMPANRRYARPWTVRFLNDLSRAYYARFHTPLIITSAVRTVAFQRHLMLINGNAAPPTGEVASPHLYGQAVDLAKHGMSITQIAWMRAYLTPVENEGKIDVEEEFQQACFHISVYRRYLGLPPRKSAPQNAAPSRTLLQAKASPTTKHRRLPSALLATGLR